MGVVEKPPGQSVTHTPSKMELQEQPLDLSRPSKPHQSLEFNLSYKPLNYSNTLHPTDIPVNLTTSSSPAPRRNSLTDHSDRSNSGSPESDCSAYFSYPPIQSGSDSESDLKPSGSPHPYHHTKRFLAKYTAQTQVVKQEPDHLINLGHLSQRISAMRDMGCHPSSQQFPGDHERFSPSPSIPATSCPPSPAGYLNPRPHVQNPRSPRLPFSGSSCWVCCRTRRAVRRTSSGWTDRGGCSSWWTARRCRGCGAPTRTSPT